MFVFAAFAAAVPDRAKLVTSSGCSLSNTPKLKEAVVGAELNRFENLEVVMQKEDAEPHVLFFEGGQQVKREELGGDKNAEEVLAIVRAQGVNLVQRAGFAAELKDEAALGQHMVGEDRFVVFKTPVLRSVAVQLAKRLKGRVATFPDGKTQKGVAEWLQLKHPEAATVHTGAYQDDAMFFWGKESVLGHRDRGRFPWAKGEPSDGDCVVLQEGLLRTRPCNFLAHALIQWTAADLAALKPTVPHGAKAAPTKKSDREL